MSGLLIKGGRVVDPSQNLDAERDVLIEEGRIARVEKGIAANKHRVIEARGRLVLPGLIDLHAHLRQPGGERSETIASGARAAIRGGFTSVLAMPNTEPPIDTQGMVEYVLQEGRKAGFAQVYPAACVTRGREGKDLVEIGRLARAGALALTDDGSPIRSSQLLRRTLEYARAFGILTIDHCEDLELSEEGAMHEGLVATRLGLRGLSPASESVAVARDVELARVTGGRIHLAHLSAKESVSYLRLAKKLKIPVTGEVTPHHFTLTDEACQNYNTNAKMNPPLRGQADLEAVWEALADGTIDAIATDHAPHAETDKAVEFERARFGVIGLETALALGLSVLVAKKILSLPALVEKMSSAPARILGLSAKGSLAVGCDADVAVVDPDAEWTVDEKAFESKSRNSPFLGRTLKGRATHGVVQGRLVLDEGTFSANAR